MNDAIRIRPATPADAADLLAIYAPCVRDTTISFETEPPTEDEFAARIAKALSRWQWLVADHEGRGVGYVYGSLHRERAAYQWSTEVSAYLHPDFRQRGIAQVLYRRLFDDLAAKGYCNALAGIALPNEASVALHRSVGFQPIGVFSKVGRKFGRWHDVAWFERRLRDEPLPEA
jgi:phosphinothricin acetyltransferase